MRDVRKGNDISVVWSLMRDGQPFDLAGLPLTLYLRNMYGRVKVDDFSVSGNQIRWVFYGKNQKHTGKYSLTLVSNEGVEGMMTTDACDFVNLVSCSCKIVHGNDECGVQTETIELTSTIDYIAGGTISIEIDSELSEESTNPVENRVITGAFKEVNEDIEGIQNKLEEVAYKDELIDIATSVQLCISPLNGTDVVKNVFKDNNLAERLGEPISCLVKKDDFEEHYRQMTLVATKVDESQYRMDFSEIGTAPYAGGFGESGRVISEELLWTPGTTILMKKTISYLYDLSSDYVFPLGESNIPDTFFINLKGLIANYKYDWEGDSCFAPYALEKFFRMSGSELRSMISNPLVKVVVCYPTEATSPLEVGRTIPLTKRVVDETILLEFAGREFFITISLDSRNFMRYSIESRTFLTEEKADETFVNKSDLATINGQRIDEGGNIIIESGGEEYDDTVLKAEIAKKADKDGVYPDMSVGKSANLLGVADGEEAEFLFRATDGDGSIKDGFASIERIEGSSVVWNQKLINGNFADGTNGWETFGGEIAVSNGIVSFTTTDAPIASYTNRLYQPFKGIVNHKYLCLFSIKPAKDTSVIYSLNINSNSVAVSAGVWNNFAQIINEKVGESVIFSIWIDYLQVGEVGDITEIKNVKLIDLTQMFGAGNEPTTIEEFYARIPQGVDLNAYNEGEVINMSADSIKTVGFNAWDEEWEVGTYSLTTGEKAPTNAYIRSANLSKCLPGEKYYIKTTKALYILWYDNNQNYISYTWASNGIIQAPSNAASFALRSVNSGDLTTYNHDICIHLVHTGYRNGEYEPYVSNEKALPIADYFPNGMNSIGDVKDELTPTEAIQRIGVEDMGTLSWYYQSASDTYPYGFFYTMFSPKQTGHNIICARYLNESGFKLDKSVFGNESNSTIYVVDSSYTDVASFKEAMSDVLLYYELAEPIVTKIDTPLDLTYPAWDFGTEEIIADTPTTPFKGSIIYEFNARDTIRANKKAIEGMAIEDYADGKLKVSINGVSKDFMAATPSGDPMHYMYIEAGVEYDEETKLWRYGGKDAYNEYRYIEGLTTKEVADAYKCMPSFAQITPIKGQWSNNLFRPRFVFCMLAKSGIAIDAAFQENTSLEFVDFRRDAIWISAIYAFYGCTNLHTIHQRIFLNGATAQNVFLSTFQGCNNLQNIKLYQLVKSIDFKDSSLLTNASILYMVANSAASSAITITLHADAYARAMADEAITAALEAHPNVSLASA